MASLDFLSNFTKSSLLLLLKILLIDIISCTYCLRPSKGWKRQATWPRKLATIFSETTENRQKRILTATIHFLNGESDIWCLLHFGCLTVKLQSLVRFFKHFLLFSLNRFANVGIIEEQSIQEGRLTTIFFSGAIFAVKFKTEYHKNLCWTESDIFFLAKLQQRHFPNLQGDGQSQKWPTKWQPPPQPPPTSKGLMSLPAVFFSVELLIENYK